MSRDLGVVIVLGCSHFPRGIRNEANCYGSWLHLLIGQCLLSTHYRHWCFADWCPQSSGQRTLAVAMSYVYCPRNSGHAFADPPGFARVANLGQVAGNGDNLSIPL